MKKLTETQNKRKKSDSSDPRDQMNPDIVLDPTDHDPSDSKVRNKWFFSFQITRMTRITDPSVSKFKIPS